MNEFASSRAGRAGSRLLTLMLVFTIAFGAFSLVSLAVGVARDGDSLLWGRTLAVQATIDPESLPTLASGLRLTGSPDVTLAVKDPTTKQMLLRSVMDLGPLLLIVAGLWALRGLARSVTRGEPFGHPNVQRLRRIGLLLVVGAPLVELPNTRLRKALFNELPPTAPVDLGVTGRLPGEALVAGLGAFILAEVFAHGVRLREDVEGTV